MHQEKSFEAGGKTHDLRFTTNALAMLEEKIGDHFMVAARRLSMRDIRAIMWTGLEGYRQEKKPDADAFTIEQAGRIIDSLGGYSAALKILLPAFQESFAPDEKEGESKSDPRPSQTPEKD
jgi:hypothetical protein